LLAFRASAYGFGQKSFKVGNVEIDVDRCPVALVSTNVNSPLRRFGSRRFLHQPDLGVATLEKNIHWDRSSDLGKSQSVPVKLKAFIKAWNVNRN
jgi:hypothetical protein